MERLDGVEGEHKRPGLQHTSAYVSVRQHAPAYVSISSIRQHMWEHKRPGLMSGDVERVGCAPRGGCWAAVGAHELPVRVNARRRPAAVRAALFLHAPERSAVVSDMVA